ncbi:U32 family peptidase [bacterium]|nr:U32 family peptidase [bacterium]
MHIPELLAPAGSIEAFRAGFNAGADAFYLGYGDFNARRRAKNFTDDEVRLAVDLAHQHGKKIYITLNTLVFDHEIEHLAGVFEHIREIRADAVIVQDWGVIALLRKFYPEIPIHASTQMFCHNSFHAEFLRDRGITRIILPRELKIDEIRSIMERVPLEYEIFIHGAMCFSFSGCCLFSSYRHGESANRGRCRQMCRFPFDDGKGTAYPFSMKDLDSLGHMRELLDLGVAAFKIEGRLKNASYVGETVSAYRALIDAFRDGASLSPDIPRLTKQRRSEAGYLLTGPDYGKLVDKTNPGTSGEVSGEVLSIHEQKIRIMFYSKPLKGLKLRIQDSAGKNLYTGTLLDFSREKSSRDGNVFVWNIRDHIRTSGFKPPFLVYVTGKSTPGNVYREMKKMVDEQMTFEPLALEIDCNADRIEITAHFETFTGDFTERYAITTSQAQSHPLTGAQVERIFSQTDRYPFRIASINCHVDDENLFCPVHSLKSARRSFYRDIYDFYNNIKNRERDRRISALMEYVHSIGHEHISEQKQMTFRYANSPLIGGSAATADFTVHRAESGQIPDVSPSQNVMLLLPLFTPEKKLHDWENWIGKLITHGYTRFMAPTYGWLVLMERYPVAEWIAGPFLYLVNSCAVDYFKQSKIRYFTLSPDLNPDDMGAVAQSGNRLIALNSPREVFATRLSVPDNVYRLHGTSCRPVKYADYTVIEECRKS